MCRARLPHSVALSLLATFILVPFLTAASPALAAPANDDCPAATPIADGVVTGDTTDATLDGASRIARDRNDVWFRYTAPADARMSVYFAAADASRFVLSAHASCPGTPLNTIGFGGRFEVSAGDEVMLRVAVREDESPGPFTLDVGPVSTISGTVTDAASGEPIPSARIAVASDSGSWETGARTDGGGYSVDIPRPGTYYLSTRDTHRHADEIWDDVVCSVEDCAADLPSNGTPIEVGRSVDISGVDFALERLGSISGRITSAATGELLHFAYVYLFDRFGTQVGFGGAYGGDGTYVIGGLPVGTYFAAAEHEGHATELYQDIPCSDPFPFGSDCDPTNGSPITVELDATTVIDFALETRGRITGTVTMASTGETVSAVDIGIYTAGPSLLRATSTDDNGVYVVGGLETGSYLVRAFAGFDELADQAYPGITCPLTRCPLSAGDPVSVVDGEVTSGIDFALDRFGRVVGTVTREGSLDEVPLEGVLVQAFDADGLYAATLTDASGRYTLPYLSGTYFATANAFDHVPELYDDVACPLPERCDVTAGHPVQAELNADTENVDFALSRQGISGTVIDLARGAPVPFATVEIWDQEGRPVTSLQTRHSGLYSVGALLPGIYFVSVHAGAYGGQLYHGLPCAGGEPAGCDPTAGAPVRVRPHAITEDVNFLLVPLGSISGTVRLAAGEPVPFATVTIWNVDGSFARSGSASESGEYVLRGLAAGIYYATAAGDDGFLAALYDGRPCPEAAPPGGPGEKTTAPPGGPVGKTTACDPTVGTPIPVALGATRSGIDFVLNRTGTIFGTVRETVTGAPAAGVSVWVWDSGGDFVGSVATDPLRGTYALSGLAPGSYFVGTRSFNGFDFAGFADQLYDQAPCFLGICDPTAGTPVEVGLNSPAVDFTLDLEQGISGRVTHQETGLPMAFAELRIRNSDGQPADAIMVGPSGVYAVGLPLGTYRVSAIHQDTLFDVVDEAYDDVPCGRNGCGLTQGEPIAVTGGAVVRNIDFALSGEVETCVATATALCLNGGRFRIEIFWQDFEGDFGLGRAGALTGDSGTFWFFGPDNIEVVVKILDACVEPFNRFWVFAAGLTNVATRLTVTDTLTSEVRTYENPLGTAFELVRDTDAFDTCDLGAGGSSMAAEVPDPAEVGGELEATLDLLAAPEPVAARGPAPAAPAAGGRGSCAPSATSLCLADGRFEVETFWRTAQGGEGPGQAVTLTDGTGTFWFFGPDNVEVMVKVLDACALPAFQSFWVFAAGLSDVEVTMRVTDTVFGEVKEYVNPLGTPFQAIQDTAAFRNCP